MKHVHINALSPKGGPVFAGLRRQTPWAALDYWTLAPRETRSVAAATRMPYEQGYVFMDGPVALTLGERRIESETGPGCIVEPTGGAHVLENLTERFVHVLRVRVVVDMDVETHQRLRNQFFKNLGVETAATQGVQFKAGTFDAQALEWRDAIHGGCGQIATRHVLSPEDFYSDWTFLDHAILALDSSVGYHYHDALEESFVVLRGTGWMTIADETFAVRPGSVTWQGIGQGHGIYNPGPEKLEFMRIAVKQIYEEYTTIDLHDDLSARKPTRERKS